ncbi:hypothetical protein L3X38_045431 [Prunus dulcis]|uniref:Uncharacterized protein n=1 Tax=Prunus dulcis TaxID=3755 RepID=A0AAD4YP67_PRUDU|nr:hypothetical protein L3X38_045431 [Prunus dulcis]
MHKSIYKRKVHSKRSRANVRLSALRDELAISVPTGEIFYVGTVYSDSAVLVGDVCLEADLIPLEMVGLDVILGMDWLVRHHASVDCFRKEVILRSPGRPEVTFYGERRVLPSSLISVMTATRLLKKGCSGYLAHIVDNRIQELQLQILDRKMQVLRSREIPLVKVLWRSHTVEEATWESEDQMREQYPYLFE